MLPMRAHQRHRFFAHPASSNGSMAHAVMVSLFPMMAMVTSLSIFLFCVIIARRTLPEGARLECVFAERDRGRQAVEILSIDLEGCEDFSDHQSGGSDHEHDALAGPGDFIRCGKMV